MCPQRSQRQCKVAGAGSARLVRRMRMTTCAAGQHSCFKPWHGSSAHRSGCSQYSNRCCGQAEQRRARQPAQKCRHARGCRCCQAQGAAAATAATHMCTWARLSPRADLFLRARGTAMRVHVSAELLQPCKVAAACMLRLPLLACSSPRAPQGTAPPGTCWGAVGARAPRGGRGCTTPCKPRPPQRSARQHCSSAVVCNFAQQAAALCLTTRGSHAAGT